MHRWYFLALFAVLPLAGCANETPQSKEHPAHPSVEARKQADVGKIEKSEADEIKESLAKLSPEDRKLAEQQKYCPDSNELLGSMGAPMKVLVKEKPVFICCKGC